MCIRDSVYVTHDQVEAMTMGDRVAVLKDGLLQQCDTPRNMYDHPKNVFVAGFIGSPAMNLFEVPVKDNKVLLGTASIPLPADARPGSNRVTLGIRPEDLAPSDAGLEVDVVMVEELGADAYVYGKTTVEGEDQQVMARVDGRRPPMKGDTLYFAPKTDHIHLFDVETGERIND